MVMVFKSRDTRVLDKCCVDSSMIEDEARISQIPVHVHVKTKNLPSTLYPLPIPYPWFPLLKKAEGARSVLRDVEAPLPPLCVCAVCVVCDCSWGGGQGGLAPPRGTRTQRALLYHLPPHGTRLSRCRARRVLVGCT